MESSSHITKMFRIAILGDVMLGRLVDQIFPNHVESPQEHKHVEMLFRHHGSKMKLPIRDYKYPWGDVLGDMLKADLRIINLETSVTTHNMKWPDKAFNYRMHPFNLKVLKEANIEYVSLANNHTLDFSYEGMMETMDSLSKNGIHWAGVGKNLEEAQRPAIFGIDGKKVACFSFADHYSYWAASQEKPGINFLDVDSYTSEDISNIKELIGSTRDKENPDLVIVSLHWGGNYCWIPSKEKQEFAHQLVDDCGVDIIHGHSSHHIQGIEIYKGKPILYGCGDFIDDYAVTEEYRNDLGFAYFVDWNFESKSVQKIELIPTKVELCAVSKNVNVSDREWLIQHMTKLCKYFETSTKFTEGKLLLQSSKK